MAPSRARINYFLAHKTVTLIAECPDLCRRGLTSIYNSLSLDLQNAVAESLSQLEDGWLSLVDVRIDGSSDVTAADYAVMHAQLGVALIDLMLAHADDPPRRLRKLMDDEGFSARFPGALPIVRLVLQSTDTWLGDQLEAAFAQAPPLTIANPHWVDALHELLVPTAPVSDPSHLPFFKRSSAGAPPPSVLKGRREEKRTWLDELWQVFPERRPPGAKRPTCQSQSMPPDRNAPPASISDEQAGAIEGQQWWPNDQRREPEVWEAAPEGAAFDSERTAPGEEVAFSRAAADAQRWRVRVAASIILVAILGSGAVWLFFGAAPSEEMTRPIEATATATSPPITAVVSVPSTAPAVNSAEPHNRVIDRREQPPAAAAAATASATAPAAKLQGNPAQMLGSQAAPKSRSNAPEAVQRPAVSVKRGDEKGLRRLIFEWPSEVEFTAKVAKGEAKIRFKSAARIDLRQLSAAASGLNPRVSRNDGIVLMLLKLPPGSRLMAHRRGNRVVLDIAATAARTNVKPRSAR